MVSTLKKLDNIKISQNFIFLKVGINYTWLIRLEILRSQQNSYFCINVAKTFGGTFHVWTHVAIILTSCRWNIPSLNQNKENERKTPATRRMHNTLVSTHGILYQRHMAIERLNIGAFTQFSHGLGSKGIDMKCITSIISKILFIYNNYIISNNFTFGEHYHISKKHCNS